MLFVGIDPGLNGGYCIWNEEIGYVQAFHLPTTEEKMLHNTKKIYDWNALKNIFSSPAFRGLYRVGIEKQHSFAGNAASSTATVMENYGELKGLLRGLSIEFEEINPQDWQEITKNYKTDTKTTLLYFAKANYSNVFYEAVKDKNITKIKSLMKAANKKLYEKAKVELRKQIKKASILYAKERFPNINLKENSRCRVDHDGMADAACICAYVSDKFYGKIIKSE